MSKLIKALVGVGLGLLVFAGTAYADVPNNLNLRVEQPQSPNNSNSFNITFVTLDNLNRPVTVKCFKKSPTDADFVQFGSDMTTANGGGTGNCQVTSSQVTTEATYQFRVETSVPDEIDTVDVTVEYKSSAPSQPVSYSKDKSGCDYRVKFKTADDGGKTSRVEIFRSDSTNFNLDSDSRVGTVYIGSNLEGTFTNTPPDCAKTYYFAIRAFDGAGNGSGVVGDSVVKTTTTTTVAAATTTTASSTTGGAIPVATSQVSPGEGEILGEATKSATEGAGLESADQEARDAQNAQQNFLSQNWIWILPLVVMVLIVPSFFLLRRKK